MGRVGRGGWRAIGAPWRGRTAKGQGGSRGAAVSGRGGKSLKKPVGWLMRRDARAKVVSTIFEQIDLSVYIISPDSFRGPRTFFFLFSVSISLYGAKEYCVCMEILQSLSNAEMTGFGSTNRYHACARGRYTFSSGSFQTTYLGQMWHAARDPKEIALQ